MCKFFSFDSDGNGNYYYFDWQERKALLADNPKNYNPDSHTSIADSHGFLGAAEDSLNKYEYNLLTGVFEVDQINTTDDRVEAEAWVRALDFKRVVEPLIIKPIVHPFCDHNRVKVTACEIALLKKWASVGASVGTSVWASVWDSVWASVWDSVGASVGASVRDSVWASVWDSVWASVWASVGDSVWASVWDSVGAYISSFFDIKYDYDFSLCVKLLEAGLVPSFDGKTWRLHGGRNAAVLYEWTPDAGKGGP